MAIIADSPWVYSTSVLIGGLIIASEEFMMSIAALMKSSSDKIADTVAALRESKATDEELLAKVKNETRQIENSQTEKSESANKLTMLEKTNEPKRKDSKSEKMNERIAKARAAEHALQPFFEKIFGGAYESHIKLSGAKSSVIVDGIVRKEDGAIGSVIEVRMIGDKSTDRVKYVLLGLKKKLRELGLRPKIVAAIVSEEMNLEMAAQMSSDIGGIASTSFFKYKNDKLEPILIPTEFSERTT